MYPSIPNTESVEPAPADRPRLLLVEGDDVRTSRRLANMLRDDGFSVEIARDGAHAIARFMRAPYPDVLVSELSVGQADLSALARFVRAQRPGLPIVIVTSRPNAVREQELGEPEPLVFTKPIDYFVLREALLTAVRQCPRSSQPSLEAAPSDQSMR
jgi:CheY-like chemotaxis protein